MLKRVFVFLLIVGLMFPLSVFADVIGEFGVINGDVTVNRVGKVLKPKVKDKVETSDTIATGKNSNTRIVLDANISMALGPDTKMEMKQYDVQGGKTTGLFFVPIGLVQTNIDKSLGPGSRFEIHTPNAICGAKGTAWLTLVELAIQNVPQSSVYALQNAVFFVNPAFPAQAMSVVAGNFTTVVGPALPTATVSFTPSVVAGLTTQLGPSALPGLTGVAGVAGAGSAGAAGGAAAAGGLAGGTVAGLVVGGLALATGVAIAAGSSSSSSSYVAPAHH
jgi:hypothetical protein